ncbi:CopD family protein [Niabella soli]|uniref:Copper resistance protein D n=1 Tax=Niabella soli DSM 19437 TaxID=929713 RepID=W0F1F5_9BACT|nr:CopD family protein [Niabella soli]AHF15284.1 copper resistance protein D [Niabella soli DSM 19437]
MNHHLLLIIHLVAATIWVGGHLYVCLCVLPGVLKSKDAGPLLRFEKSFEPLGMPALVLLVGTGIWMALQFGVYPSQWFSFASPLERVVSVKLLLLLLTVVLALSAQLRVIPTLKQSAARLNEMAVHVVLVTLIALAMLVLGSFIRYGGI